MQAALGGGVATPEGVPTAVALSFYPHGAASHQPRLRRPPCRLNLGGGDRRIPPVGAWGRLHHAQPLPHLATRTAGATPGGSCSRTLGHRPGISAASPAGHRASAKLALPGPGHLPAPTVSGAAQLPATPGPGTSVRLPLPQPLGRRPVSSRRPSPFGRRHDAALET